MRRMLLGQPAAMLCLFISLVHAGQGSDSETWSPNDMKSGGLEQKNELTVPIDVSCGSSPCKMFYFTGDGFDPTNLDRKNILYIGGGPGNIVKRKQRDLQDLESKYNVVYFDIRAAGLSFIPEHKSYDRFLRARFVVEDIEKLRREVLKEDKRPWDVIYAHSWGTLVAQQYAKVYGPSNKVLNLILSAPVSRVQENIERDRNEMIRSNLDKIYAHYKKKPCAVDGRLSNLIPRVMQPVHAVVMKVQGKFVEPTNDFCSLSPQRLDIIKNNMTAVMQNLDKQSLSLNFVSENYETLVKSENKFFDEYPYGKAFFMALRALQYWGGPDEGQVFADEIKERQVSAAIVIGYYLSAELEDLRKNSGRDCNESESSFIKDLAGDTPIVADSVWKKLYCTRFAAAKTSFESTETELRSNRAYAVFGLYDGLNLDFFRKVGIPGEKTTCIKGSNIENYKNSSAEKDFVFRQLLRRIGSVPLESACRWNPANFRHRVPTLILKGGADAIIAGGQAEYVFESGLEGEKRVLIEIPGMGHNMAFPVVKINDTDVMCRETLLENFLKLSATNFVRNGQVNQVLSTLGAKSHLPKEQ
jgi:pimeloyl-ACP methyl ester carboxylesterase